jgi:uncharacterized protein YpmS
MPTILRDNGYRFFFFSDEHLPKHIHVEKGDSYIRIELENFQVTHRYKVSQKEIKKIIKIVKQKQQILLGAWDEHFKK